MKVLYKTWHGLTNKSFMFSFCKVKNSLEIYSHPCDRQKLVQSLLQCCCMERNIQSVLSLVPFLVRYARFYETRKGILSPSVAETL